MRKSWVVIGGTAAVIIALAVLGFVFLRPSNGLPKSIVKQADFAVLYPQPMPLGYELKKDSVKYIGGVLFYTLQTDASSVRVSEQRLPDAPPDLSSVPGLKKFDTVNGSGYLGINAGVPVAVLQTNTALVTLTGDGKTPKDHLTRLGISLASY